MLFFTLKRRYFYCTLHFTCVAHDHLRVETAWVLLEESRRRARARDRGSGRAGIDVHVLGQNEEVFIQ